MCKPNLFTYATSELSQDAFFCWLFEWAKDDLANVNNALQKASKAFLIELLPAKINYEYKITDIKVQKQFPVNVKGKKSKKKIDFIVEINKEILLVFENKTASTTNTAQLQSYLNIENKYSKFKDNIFYFYLKSDIVWEKEKKLIEENNYHLIDIFRIAQLMPKTIGNAIYDDYVEKIKKRIEGFNNYKTIIPAKWRKDQWLGFLFDFIKKTGVGTVSKHYVGDNYWFWLSSHNNCFDIKCHISLEFVAGKFAIKTIAAKGQPKLNKNINNIVRKKVKEVFINHKGKISNRNGDNTSTIFEFKNYFVTNENGLIDFEKTYNSILEIKERFDGVRFEEN